MNDFEPTSTAVRERRPNARRLLSKKTGAWFVAAGLTCAAAGLAGAGTASAADLPVGGGPVAAPSDGGATGIVDAKSTSSFSFKTAAGVEVTVDEDSSTKYKVGILPAWEGVVKEGASVLVLGLVNSSTITATQVIVQPWGDGGAAAAQAAGVVPFQQGVPSPTQSVGQIPAYTEGDGTIVSGTTADKATAAAQSVVPGGVANRVVVLSGGEYEVHNVGINWPHHVFVSKDFKVLGYE